MTYWINTVSRSHVLLAVAGGFTQANHGKPHMLRRMQRDDWITFYSPRTAYPEGDPLQAFTAIGRVSDDEPYQADNGHWRRRVDFLDCREKPIRPLIDGLDFITDKARWGYRFRFGVFAIDEPDFVVLRTAMCGSDAITG
jgi:EVE domain